MGYGVITRRLHPSNHLHFGKPARSPVLVRFLYPVADIFQKVVGVPVLGVIVLDVTLFDVADHDNPSIVLMLTDDNADKIRVVDDVAERTQDARAFGLWHKKIIGRKL